MNEETREMIAEIKAVGKMLNETMEDIRAELKEELQDIRIELREEIQEMRMELKEEIQEMKEQMDKLEEKLEVVSYDTEYVKLKTDIIVSTIKLYDMEMNRLKMDINHLKKAE